MIEVTRGILQAGQLHRRKQILKKINLFPSNLKLSSRAEKRAVPSHRRRALKVSSHLQGKTFFLAERSEIAIIFLYNHISRCDLLGMC